MLAAMTARRRACLHLSRLRRTACVLLCGSWLCLMAAAKPLLAVPPTDRPTAQVPAGELETAALSLASPVTQRRVVRNERGLYDVWLLTASDFEQVTRSVHQAVGGKRLVPGGLRFDRVTWLEPDRSYLVDLVSGGKFQKLRLSRHLQGSLLECADAGLASEAPRWTPPYHPRPLLLWHGPVR